MKPIFIASYFGDLFTVEEEGLAILPYLITAVTLGVILAGVYFTFWRALESKLLKKLTEAGADCSENAKSLEELGFGGGDFHARVLRHLLASPSCMVYRTVSSTELDGRRESGFFSEKEKKERRKQKISLSVTKDTALYILPDRAEYAKEKVGAFSLDDYMGLIYTTIGALAVWFVLMSSLDTIIGWFQ